MSVEVYVVGIYDKQSSIMSYFGYFDIESGRKAVKGQFAGSRLETEASVIGVALKYAYENSYNINLHTNLTDAVKYANGEWKKPTAKRICDYLKYLKKVEERIEIKMANDLTEKQVSEIAGYMSAEQETTNVRNPFKKDKQQASNAVGWKSKPVLFRVVVYDMNGKVLCDLTDKDFGEKNLSDAIFFADWYENEGNKVERYNVPKGKKKQ